MSISLLKNTDSRIIHPGSDPISAPYFPFVHGSRERIDKYIISHPVPYAKRLPDQTRLIFKQHNLPVSLHSCQFTRSNRRRSLLSENAKTVKGKKYFWDTKTLMLAAASRSGFNLCAFSTPECRSLCLGHTSGQLGIQHKNYRQFLLKNPAQLAHFLKSVWFKVDPLSFLRQLVLEIKIAALELDLEKVDHRLCIRLNCLSDLQWWTWLDLAALSKDYGVVFYDYTKRPIPPNIDGYHLTFSISEHESSWKTAQKYLDMGLNAAIVVGGKDTSSRLGMLKSKATETQEELVERGSFIIGSTAYPVVNGDLTDLRFLDAPGSVVILKAKGPEALRSESPFIYRNL